MNRYDTDPDDVVRITTDKVNTMIIAAKHDGYNAAIKWLLSMEADGLHEMYASGFAEYLVNKREELLR